MEFKQEDINDFKRIWKKEFGDQLTDDQARSEGRRLVEFFLLIAEWEQEDKERDDKPQAAA